MTPLQESGTTDGSAPIIVSTAQKNGTAPTIPADINTLDRLAAAQFYFNTLGWAIHPLFGPDRGEPRERGKKPILKAWRQHTVADINSDDLAKCFGPGTDHNIGCVVRPPFVHVDLDSKSDAGVSVMEWLATMPELAAVPRERTGGGVHLAFICRDLPEAILKPKQAPTCKINDKVDAELYLNSLNLVLSPSVHKSGHQYTWEVTGEIPQVSWARIHALARLITPFCRGLMNWKRTPLWIYDGNREGSGKDTCADVTHNLYTGRNVTGSPLSKDGDEEMRKRITAALIQGARFFHLANMKGHVRFSSLEAATDNSGFWDDRILGASESITLQNETEFSISANNATWEPDIERRCRRIRLRFTPDYVNGHRYKHESVLEWVRQHRPDLLSAVNALVAHWVRAGCPPGPTPFTSFPEWGRVVGGVLHCAGLQDPCLPHEESSVSGDKDTDAMRRFFAMGHEHFGNQWTNKDAVYEWVRDTEAVQELFEWIDFSQKRGTISFGKLLARFDGRELGGIVFGVQRTSANFCKYLFSRAGGPDTGIPHTPHTPHSHDISDSVRCEVEGCVASSSNLAEIIHEKSKRENNGIFSPYKNRGQVLTQPHTSHSGTLCTSRSDLDRIALDLTGASRIALDIETYGPRKGDGLDP